MKLRTPYFKNHLKWLMVLGIDIVPIKNVWYKHIYNVYATFILSFVIMYGMLELIDTLVASDFNSMTFGLCYCATHLIGIAKICLLIAKKKKFQEMFDKLESGIFLPNMERGGEEEFRLINSAVNRCAKHAQAFNTLVYIIILIRCLFALFSTEYNDEFFDEDTNTTIPIHKRTLPYRIWLPLDTTKSPLFEILFFIQPFTLTLYGYYIGYMDSMVYGMMIHMDTQFLILKRVLERYVQIAKNRVLKNVETVATINHNKVIFLPVKFEGIDLLAEPLQKEIENIVTSCAKHHEQIIYFCDEVEDEFSYLMLSQFLFSLYTFCFQLYQLSLVENVFGLEFISMCCFLLLLMYQLFCYCWYGNEIKERSGKFSEDLYHSDWLVLNDSIKKSLLLMMMRAQRPIQFTAGKFALLSLQTFMSIVRGSASYFMVLKQMNT